MKNLRYILVSLSGLMLGLPQFSSLAVDSLRLESTFHAPAQTSATSPSPKVGLIVNATGASISERYKAVHSLSDDLGQPEIRSLLNFLAALPDGRESNLEGVRVLKNDILNVLIENQNAETEGLTEVLTGIYQNQEQDAVMRDYAIQHLIGWYKKKSGPESKTKEKVRKILREAFGKSDSIAGTALLGLHRISIVDPLIDSQQVNQRALALALSDETQVATRITAIQVCSERHLKEVLPTIQLLMQNPGPIPLRLSAIAALGCLGNSEHLTLLRPLESESNELIQTAVRSALTRLSQKQELF